MRTFSLVVLWAGLTVQDAQARNIPGQDEVAVCVDGSYPFAMLARAEAIASSIYQRIGIRLKWFHDSRCPVDGIQVAFNGRQLPSFHPKALAHAFPFEGRKIEVFSDRFQTVYEPLRPVLLGLVLAHEIGHMLQGVNHHSEIWVMKALWTGQDFAAMLTKPLTFTENDVILIQSGLACRQAHSLSSKVVARR